MKVLGSLAFLLFTGCAMFQPVKDAPEKPAASVARAPRVKSQERVIVQKLLSYVAIITKPKTLKSRIDQNKTFTYNAVLKAPNQAGTITFEIKPDGDKFRYVCKIVIETVSQEETVEFTSTDAAEVIRQLRVTLGGSENGVD